MIPPQKNKPTLQIKKVRGKIFPLQAQCGPEGGQWYSSTFRSPRHQKGVSGKQHVPAAFYPRERHGTHFTGGWVGPRADLDGRKISSSLGFDPGPSSPQSVAIKTELPGPNLKTNRPIYVTSALILNITISSISSSNVRV